jgi:hypothetical protein
MMEPYGELVDDLADQMTDPEQGHLDPAMTLAGLRSAIERNYGWALDIDFGAPEAQHFFWYRSAEKEEPRLGERLAEPGAELETRIGVARDAAALHRVLSSGAWEDGENVAAFLLCEPQWRHMIKRFQLAENTPYGEIRDNLLGEDCLPIDILRCKLSLFGAAVVVRRHQIRPQIRPLDPHHHVPGRTGLRRAGRRHGGRLGLSGFHGSRRAAPMKRSLNEVQRICQKAAEGAGAPAGLDGDAAHGAAWLLAHDLPALSDLAEDLTRCPDLAAACRFDRNSFSGHSQVVEAADKAGAAIAPMLIDLLVARTALDGEPGRLRVSSLTAPLFLLPPAIGYAAQGVEGEGWRFHLSLAVDEERRFALRVAAEGKIDILGPADLDLADLFEAKEVWSLDAVCTPDLLDTESQTEFTILLEADQLAAVGARSLAEGVSPDPEAWDRLQALAAKVLVPATEQSHRLGAGAHSSDNE